MNYPPPQPYTASRPGKADSQMDLGLSGASVWVVGGSKGMRAWRCLRETRPASLKR
jgi:hypothetical protein